LAIGDHKLYSDAAHTTEVPLSTDPGFFGVGTIALDQDFYDSPSPHIMYNLKRGLRVAEKLIEHGESSAALQFPSHRPLRVRYGAA
jgi:hypothetical protein